METCAPVRDTWGCAGVVGGSRACGGSAATVPCRDGNDERLGCRQSAVRSYTAEKEKEKDHLTGSIKQFQ